ncbi:MAG: adenylate/guanylate cyclase domain-containing protein [Chloroflexota bacterium]|nr:AAA family ATPase [Chloroflexota bacterium]
MNCLVCDTPLKSNKRYCTHCGTPPLRLCTTCHAESEADDLYCGECGSKLPETNNRIAHSNKSANHEHKTKAGDHENERRFVTILFADLVGFTNFSTQKDPEEVSRLVRDLVEIFEPEITSRGGVVDKYEGDAVLARFGAPIVHEDDAEQALMAAIALHRRIAELDLKHQRPDGQPFRLRIGLNTGEVIAGTIDRGGRDYTVLGDVVNTSQRFQTAAQPGETVVGELTYRLTRNAFDFEPMGTLTLKGKPKPALAYRLSGLKVEPGDGRGLEINADAGPRAGDSHFVGRVAELEILNRAYEEARLGQGQLAYVIGETGNGKSRLVRHFLQNHNQHRLIIGRAFSFTSEIPHALLGNLLTHMLGLHPSETLVQPTETRHRLAELALRTGLTDGFEDLLELSLLAEALGLPDENGLLSKLTIHERGSILQRTVKELICGLSQIPAKEGESNQPLVVLLEDMHWADRPSAQAIELLIKSLNDYPLLLIINSRPEWNPPIRWNKLPYYQRIKLDLLSNHERIRLLHYALHKAGLNLPPEVEREVIERTGGNPFFMEEMILALKESMQQAAADGNNETILLAVPATIQELLLARIDRLDQSARRILQIGAVLGRRFPERLMRWVATQAFEVEHFQLDQGLQHLKGQELLLENRLAQELEFFFKHGMMQEVAYNIMLTERKQVLHELAGAALEELYVGREDEVIGLLTYHYGHSNNREKALRYLVHAAERATIYDAHEEALLYYQQAVALADDTNRAELEAHLEQMKN